MELLIINHTQEEQWMKYEQDFIRVMKQCEKTLDITKDYSVSLIFTDAKEIHEINRSYRNIDRPTDVISFAMMDSENDYEMPEGENELGDIFISIDAVREQAESYGHSVRREVCFLFTHGLLHLLGYDHMNEEDEKVMFQIQDVIIDEIVPKKKCS